MTLPDDPVVWIVGLVLLAVVLIVALLKADRLSIETDPFRVHFTSGRDAKAKAAENESSGSRVSVAEGARITNSETGDIVGVQGNSVTGEVDLKVANKAEIENSKTGKIAGIASQDKQD